ncbi:RAB22A (predicted) [Pycnogonum litorale]
MSTVHEVKICLLGDCGVGKSSIVQRFVNDTFNYNVESTIGASFMAKNLIIKGHVFKFQIWDTAGQERYRALAPMYYSGSGAAIIVFDVTNKETFRSLKSWVHELRQHGPRNLVLALAGNKCDMDDRREVTEDESSRYADEINAVFEETSALKDQNIAKLFEALSDKLITEQIPRSRGSLMLSTDQLKNKCC